MNTDKSEEMQPVGEFGPRKTGTAKKNSCSCPVPTQLRQGFYDDDDDAAADSDDWVSYCQKLQLKKK